MTFNAGLTIETFQTASGLSIQSVTDSGVMYAVFDLAMHEVRTTELGKHDWRARAGRRPDA